MKFSFYAGNGRVCFFCGIPRSCMLCPHFLKSYHWPWLNGHTPLLSSSWPSVLHASHSVHKAFLWTSSLPVVFSLPVISVSSSFRVCLYWILFWYPKSTSLFYSAVCVLLEFRRSFAFSLSSLSVTMNILWFLCSEFNLNRSCCELQWTGNFWSRHVVFVFHIVYVFVLGLYHLWLDCWFGFCCFNSGHLSSSTVGVCSIQERLGCSIAGEIFFLC